MHTESGVLVDAKLEVVYRLAAEVERWPEILPHYRWVRVLADAGAYRVVEMAAHRDGIPVWWCAEQRRQPELPRIAYRHVRGISRGMEVEWSFKETGDGVLVTIRHDLTIGWPLVGRFVANSIIGPLFVETIARKTLRRIKVIAEGNGDIAPDPAASANPRSATEGSARGRGA